MNRKQAFFLGVVTAVGFYSIYNFVRSFLEIIYDVKYYDKVEEERRAKYFENLCKKSNPGTEEE